MTTGSEESRIYGHCRTCNDIGVYFDVPTHSYYYLDGRPHEGHKVEFEADASLAPANPVQQVTEHMTPPKVAQRITDAGYYYRLRSGYEEIGCFTAEDEQNPELDQGIANKLSVDIKDILAARLYEVQRPATFEEVAQVLGSTIRHDQPNKLILFAAGLLTFTDEDQFNTLMSGESAGGKSYTAQEVVAYFPPDIVRWIGGASPSAFFHDENLGKWDPENHVLRVDLRQKIIMFLDQPGYQLMEKLRPLLSHDRKELLYKITDKSKRGSLRTKSVVLVGYPTVIFCAAKLSLDEQERTRVFILSPETDQHKLEESILLRIKHDGDRETFKRWVEIHPRRRWLKARIAAIRAANIDQIIVEDQEAIYKRFLQDHARLAPRHQRDVGRILALIKAHALLNWCHRKKQGPHAIVANWEDVDAGFKLYSQIARSNELGLAPALYVIWDAVIRPLILRNEMGVSNRSIMAEYHQVYGRFLPDRRLRREIIPALESCGLILLEPDPNDKRQKLVTLALPDTTCLPHDAHISDTCGVKSNVDDVRGAPPPDTAEQPPGPLGSPSVKNGGVI